MSYKQLYCSVVLALVTLLPGIGHAVNCSDSESEWLTDSYETALTNLFESDCFSPDNNADDALVKRYDSLTPDVGLSSQQRVDNLLAATQHLLDHANRMVTASPTDSANWAKLALALSNQLIGIQQAVATSDSAKAEAIAKKALDIDQWAIIAEIDQAVLLPGVSIFGDVDARCPAMTGSRSPGCAAYRGRKELLLALNLADQITNYGEAGASIRQLNDSRIENKKWAAYFNDAHFQWWWEVLANGRRMRKGDYCKRDSETSVRQGFCDVPTDQIILLHPDVALQYVDGADASDELGSAFLVEVYGRNKWEFGADGSLRNARGWSVIATHANLDESPNWGYGLMYHYRNRYSFGVTSTAGNVGAILSVDLSDKLFERKAKYRAFLQDLDKPDFWDEVFTRD